MEEGKCPRVLRKSRRTQKAHLASPWKSFSLAQDESAIQHSGSQSLSGLLARVTPTPPGRSGVVPKNCSSNKLPGDDAAPAAAGVETTL